MRYIGVGGFGAVTLEKEKSTGEIYALKALSKGHLVTESACAWSYCCSTQCQALNFKLLELLPVFS